MKLSVLLKQEGVILKQIVEECVGTAERLAAAASANVAAAAATEAGAGVAAARGTTVVFVVSCWW